MVGLAVWAFLDQFLFLIACFLSARGAWFLYNRKRNIMYIFINNNDNKTLKVTLMPFFCDSVYIWVWRYRIYEEPFFTDEARWKWQVK